MSADKGVVHRGPVMWWPQAVVPLAAFGVAWLAGRGLAVACGAAVAAAVIVAVLTPRRPGRWTE